MFANSEGGGGEDERRSAAVFDDGREERLELKQNPFLLFYILSFPPTCFFFVSISSL